MNCSESEMRHNIIRPDHQYMFLQKKKKKWLDVQGCSVQRLDMGLVYKTGMTCGVVYSYEHAQASDQETLDLHNVPSTQLKLIWAHRTVVHQRYTGTSH